MLRFFKRAAGRAVDRVIFQIIMASIGLVAISYLSDYIKTLI